GGDSLGSRASANAVGAVATIALAVMAGALGSWNISASMARSVATVCSNRGKSHRIQSSANVVRGKLTSEGDLGLKPTSIGGSLVAEYSPAEGDLGLKPTSIGASLVAEYSPAWFGSTRRSFRQSRHSSRNALITTWMFAPDCFP